MQDWSLSPFQALLQSLENGGGAENGKIPEFLAGFFAFSDEGKGMD